jgi:hypothetical protein
MFKRLLLLSALLLASATARASYQDPDVDVSTGPIGSSYYRHLAQMTNIDLHELVKFERRGFGRTEINVLVVISSGSIKTMKDYGNRRLKDNVPLDDLIKEAHRDHDEVYRRAREMKAAIEAMGDQNLPPPVYEVANSTPDAAKKEKKEKKPSPLDTKVTVPKPED